MMFLSIYTSVCTQFILLVLLDLLFFNIKTLPQLSSLLTGYLFYLPLLKVKQKVNSILPCCPYFMLLINMPNLVAITFYLKVFNLLTV